MRHGKRGGKWSCASTPSVMLTPLAKHSGQGDQSRGIWPGTRAQIDADSTSGLGGQGYIGMPHHSSLTTTTTDNGRAAAQPSWAVTRQGLSTVLELPRHVA